MDEKTKKTIKTTLFSALTIVVALSFSVVALTYSWFTSNDEVSANVIGITVAEGTNGDTLGITSPESQIVQNSVTLTVSRLLVAAPGPVMIDQSSNPERHYFSGKWYLRTPFGLKEQNFMTPSEDTPYLPSNSANSNSTNSANVDSSSSLSETSSSFGAIIKNDVTSILTCAYFDLHLYVDEENNVQRQIYCTSKITSVVGDTPEQTAKNNALASSIRYTVELVNIYRTDPFINLATPWLLFNNAFSQYDGENETFTAQTYPAHTRNIIVPPKSQVRILFWIDAGSSECELAYEGTTKLTLYFDFIGNQQ